MITDNPIRDANTNRSKHGILPVDRTLDRRIAKLFQAIPSAQHKSDVMPISTILSAWVLAHVEKYEALPMSRLDMLCARNFVDTMSVIHRISHNSCIRLTMDGGSGEIGGATSGEKALLKKVNGVKLSSFPIVIPVPVFDASMNYDLRAEYILSAYNLRLEDIDLSVGAIKPIEHEKASKMRFDFNLSDEAEEFLDDSPIFCDPPSDELADYYIMLIEPHQDIKTNICLFSLAVFYASPARREQYRGNAGMLLAEYALYKQSQDEYPPANLARKAKGRAEIRNNIPPSDRIVKEFSTIPGNRPSPSSSSSLKHDRRTEYYDGFDFLIKDPKGKDSKNPKHPKDSKRDPRHDDFEGDEGADLFSDYLGEDS